MLRRAGWIAAGLVLLALLLLVTGHWVLALIAAAFAAAAIWAFLQVRTLR
jgi:membrane protein implicated in regulation of membrane protease activity